jgi:hypothetical protein
MGIEKRENLVVAVVNLQMATELALKYFLSLSHGLDFILSDKNRGLSETELQNRYYDNKLKLRQFESLKEIEKSNDRSGTAWLFDEVKNFQDYRNHLVHLNHNFSRDEIGGITRDIVSILVYVLDSFVNLYEDEESKNKMQGLIHKGEYKKLLENEQYYDELKIKLFDEYGDVYFCPHCDKQLLVPTKICFGCMAEFYHGVGYLTCKFCEKNTLIYDDLNMECNGNVMRGKCVNCHEDAVVYKCPRCETAYDLESTDGHCTEDRCVNQ